jgi:hypothetical protein
VQAEAIPPDTLADIIRAGIEARIDRDILAETLAREDAVRTMSRAAIGALIRRLPPQPGEGV